MIKMSVLVSLPSIYTPSKELYFDCTDLTARFNLYFSLQSFNLLIFMLKISFLLLLAVCQYQNGLVESRMRSVT